ncbi:sensor histidine kinase [Cecembia lonarensis]|nr:7TM diverse intracellular signaling domain-containing protein [Cecembia lonarensis]
MANDIFLKPAYLLIEDQEDYPLEDHLQFFEDQEGLDLSGIFEAYRQHKFQALGHPYLFNKGFSQSIWWFALALENATETENSVILSPASASLLEGTLYILNDEGKLMDTKRSGYGIRNEDRDMDTRLISYQITLAPKERVILLLKTDSRGRNTYIPFFLDNVDSYWIFEVNRAAFFGGLSTVLCFAVLFALLLFIYLRERIYLIFVAYALSCLLMILEEDGYAYHWLYGEEGLHALSQIGIPFFGLLTSAFFLKFNLHFQTLDNNRLRLYQIPWLISYLALFWAALMLVLISFRIDANLLLKVNLLAMYLSIFCVAFVLLINISQMHKRMGLYILSANLFLVIGLTFYLLNSLGYTSINPFYPNGLVIGALVNVLAFTVGIGYRNYKDRNDKEALLIQISENEKQSIKEKLQVQEAERQRIARDLHDDLGALLAMIRLKVENVEHKLSGLNGQVIEGLSESVMLLDKAAKDVRFIAHELASEELDQKQFKTLVEDLFQILKAQHQVKFSHQVAELPKLPTPIKGNLFRIIKELLNNILKHAEAQEAELELFYDEEDEEIKLIVSDNGKGFDWKKVKEEKKGMGISNLENRVAFLKGTYEISSGPQGTSILVCIPYDVKTYEKE